MKDMQQHHDTNFIDQHRSCVRWLQAITGALIITWAALQPASATTFHRMALKERLERLPRVTSVPRIYSPYERAVKLQHLLHLTTTPTLGKPISLGPAKPVIPGLADIEFESVFHIQPVHDSYYGPPVAVLAFQPSDPGAMPVRGEADIKFRGRANKRYAIDCRADDRLAKYPIDFNVAGEVKGSGTVQLGADGHIVFATSRFAKNGLVRIQIRPRPKEKTTYIDFYGCEISPF